MTQIAGRGRPPLWLARRHEGRGSRDPPCETRDGHAWVTARPGNSPALTPVVGPATARAQRQAMQNEAEVSLLDRRIGRIDGRQGRGRSFDRLARDPVGGRAFADRSRRHGDDLFRGAGIRQPGRRGASLWAWRGRERLGAGGDGAAIPAVWRGDWEALQRLSSDGHAVEATPWSFVVIGGSIVVDFFRAGVLYRVAGETASEALEADAFTLAPTCGPRSRSWSGSPRSRAAMAGRTRRRPSWWRCSSASPAGGSAAAPSRR